MHLHILGICGTFMAGIAALAREAGHRVSGSDANAWPPMSTQLEALGIDIRRGYEIAHLDSQPDVVVVGNVVTRGERFPVMEHVLNQGIPYLSGPQWLAENILPGKHVLAVAGTHGKTTTTSILSWMLEHAGLEPGFLVGGVPLNFGVSARIGGGQFFVIEADEYDTAFFDKRSKFVHYRPRTCVLNNLEFDHADIFPDLASIERQFHHLVRTVPSSGKLVVNGADENLDRVLEMGCWSEVIKFDLPDQAWSATQVGPHLTVFNSGQCVTEGKTELLGPHNRSNALAALVAAMQVGVSPNQAMEALASFQNVRRRLELIGEVDGVLVYDDFAHHPTAVALTVEALREQDGGRVLAVLEPRSNTMRLGTQAADLVSALSAADQCFVHVRPDLNWNANAVLQGLGAKLTLTEDLDTLVDQIGEQARSGDRVLIMSNGDFGGVHKRILTRLADRTSGGN